MIEYLWPTPVLRTRLSVSKDDMEFLREFSLRYASETPDAHTLPVIEGQTLKYQRNFFTRSSNTPNEIAVLERFKSAVMKEYLAYIQEVYKVENATDLKVMIRAIPVIQTPGQRTMPHYHHTCDHVCCFYLDTGDAPESTDPRIGNGELITCDPRPMRTFPFWEKTHWISTYPGLFVLHPAGIWHETNTFSGSGTRVLIATTLRIESHNYTDLYCEA